MSRENVEIVRRVIDVMDAYRHEAALPVFLDEAHLDVEWRVDPGGRLHGHRGVREVRDVILDRLDTLDFDQETEELISVDTRWWRSSAGLADGDERRARRSHRPRWSGRSGTNRTRVVEFYPRPRRGPRSRGAVGVGRSQLSLEARDLDR